MQIRHIWIEAEEWAPGEWSLENDNTDVIVTLADGSKWVATYFTYSNIVSLTEKNKASGECLGGKYFWASGMILADDVSQERIEEIVRHLIETGEFEQMFKRCD